MSKSVRISCPEDLPPGPARDKLRALLDAENAKTVATLAAQCREVAESFMQVEFGQWLIYRGYWPRTEKYLTGHTPPRGWQIHLYNCRGNPTLLDSLIISNEGQILEVELKTLNGRIRKGQKAILAASPAFTRLARELEAAQMYVLEWERAINERAEK